MSASKNKKALELHNHCHSLKRFFVICHVICTITINHLKVRLLDWKIHCHKYVILFLFIGDTSICFVFLRSAFAKTSLWPSWSQIFNVHLTSFNNLIEEDPFLPQCLTRWGNFSLNYYPCLEYYGWLSRLSFQPYHLILYASFAVVPAMYLIVLTR